MRQDPSACSRPCRRASSPTSPRTPSSSPRSPRPRRISTATSPRPAGTRPGRRSRVAPPRHRLLQPGVRHHRGAPAVLRRPRHPGRRPPQDGLRPRRPDRRRGAVLQDRLLQAEPEPGRLAAGDLPGPRPGRPAHLPAPRGGRHPERHHALPARRPGAARPRVACPGRTRAAAPARLRRPGERRGRRNVTNRLYGGGGEQRLQQEMLLGMGGVRALRLWSRLTGAPAPDVYHTNEGHAGFLGIERIHELATAHGLSFDEALQAVRAATVFTHARAGRHRPVHGRAHRAALRRRAGDGGCRDRPPSRTGRRGLPRRRGRHVQHGRHGPAASRSAPTASRSCTAS